MSTRSEPVNYSPSFATPCCSRVTTARGTTSIWAERPSGTLDPPWTGQNSLIAEAAPGAAPRTRHSLPVMSAMLHPHNSVVCRSVRLHDPARMKGA